MILLHDRGAANAPDPMLPERDRLQQPIRQRNIRQRQHPKECASKAEARDPPAYAHCLLSRNWVFVPRSRLLRLRSGRLFARIDEFSL